jgi:hypothetical protein
MARLTTAPALAALIISGCASQAPGPTQYTRVNVEVPVSCVPAAFPKDAAHHPTPAELAAMDGPTRYARLLADWAARVSRMSDDEAVVEGCRVAVPAVGLRVGDALP